MIRSLVVLLVAVVVWVPGVGDAQELRIDPCVESDIQPVEDVITFPSEVYPSLQAAACGLVDGGTLRLRRGTFEGPFEVWGKHIRIVGRGNARNWPTVRMPASTTVVDWEHAVGTITVGIGGSIDAKKVRLKGGDAGILSLPGAGPVDLKQAVIEQSGRGILHLSSSALTLKRSVVKKTLWNGISYAPFDPPRVCGGLNVAGIYLRGCAHEIAHTPLLFNEGGGIVAISSLISVHHVDIRFADFWAVLLVNTAASLTHLDIRHTDTAALSSGVSFGGDALSVWTVDEPWAAAGPRPSFARIEDVMTFDSERVAVANIGSHVQIEDSTFSFQGFDFQADPHAGFPAVFEKFGEVRCYPAPLDCVADGVGVTAPPPVGGGE